jgi:hypothetical protein
MSAILGHSTKVYASHGYRKLALHDLATDAKAPIALLMRIVVLQVTYRKICLGVVGWLTVTLPLSGAIEQFDLTSDRRRWYTRRTYWQREVKHLSCIKYQMMK